MMTATTSLDQTVASLIEALGPGAVSVEAALGSLTTYRVGGLATAIVMVEDEDDLARVAGIVAGTETPILVVGRGSNLLVADTGFEGVAIRLGEKFSEVHIDSTTVRASAAAKLPVVARASVNAGLTGFEWAVGVPGSIGGSVKMNAGGHGAELSDSLLTARIIDLATGELRTRTKLELHFGYRSSGVTSSQLVTGVVLELARGDQAGGRAKMAEIVQWRRANQPGGQNAGSVFTNPSGDTAGRLIDAAGAKGLRIGTAEVSTKHANFIQADEGGLAADVLAVMNEVKRMVRESQGVELSAETHLVGFDTDSTDTTSRTTP